MSKYNYTLFIDDLNFNLFADTNILQNNEKNILFDVLKNVNELYYIEKNFNKNNLEIYKLIARDLGKKESNKKESNCTTIISYYLNSLVKKNIEKIEIEKLFAKLFKLIAINCHPDKTSDQKKNKIFIYANDCRRNLDCVKLIYLLSLINIINIKFNDLELDYIRKNIKEIYDKKEHIKKTVIYNWNGMNTLQKYSYLNIFKNNKNIF